MCPRTWPRWTPATRAIQQAAAAGRLSLTLTGLVPGALHMHANRLLRSAQRAQELVLYDFLARLDESRAARLRSAQHSP
jgi:hypothetical protein